MSCEVANSPFCEPGFPNHSDNIDLSAVSEFNAGLNQGCIDPQSLSNAGSPPNHHDPTLTPQYTPENYPADFDSVPTSPYFHSVEQPTGAPFLPSHQHVQHLHRRSVSEPPEGALMHHIPQSSASVTFHRDGHQLGIPRAEAPFIKKVKKSRSQPYQRSHRKPQPVQSRYQLRRSYTQPTNLPPTSVPHGLPPQHQQHMQMQMHMHHVPFEQIPREQQYVSSRVCTPAPEAVDPFLSAVPGPMGAPMGGLPMPMPQLVFHGPIDNGPNKLTIKMGVDELRALITDAVQKAVEGLQPPPATASARLDPVIEDDAGEEIVVAGSSAGEKGDVLADQGEEQT